MSHIGRGFVFEVMLSVSLLPSRRLVTYVVSIRKKKMGWCGRVFHICQILKHPSIIMLMRSIHNLSVFCFPILASRMAKVAKMTQKLWSMPLRAYVTITKLQAKMYRNMEFSLCSAPLSRGLSLNVRK
jgi:hypothetical protein